MRNFKTVTLAAMGLFIGLVSGCKGKQGPAGAPGASGTGATPPTFTLDPAISPTCEVDSLNEGGTGNTNFYSGLADFNIITTNKSPLICTSWGAANDADSSCTLYQGPVTLAPGAASTQFEIDCISDTDFSTGPNNSVTFFVTCTDTSTGLSATIGGTALACANDYD